MATARSDAAFSYEIEQGPEESIGPVTTLVCHGRIVSETSNQLREAVKPLIPGGGKIILDLTGVEYMDSSGLGTLVGLKVSALKEGYCKLELLNLSSRVREILRLSNLASLFNS